MDITKRGTPEFQPDGTDPQAMEQFFQACEDPWCYKGRPEFRDRASRFVSAVMPYRTRPAPCRPFNRLLDLGCAEGYVTHLIAPMADYVRGVDVSETALARARRDYGDECEFEVGDLVDYRPDAPFDLVVVAGVMYYVGNRWPAVHATIDRCMAKDGVLLTAAIKESSESDGFASRLAAAPFLSRLHSFEFRCGRNFQSCHVWRRTVG